MTRIWDDYNQHEKEQSNNKQPLTVQIVGIKHARTNKAIAIDILESIANRKAGCVHFGIFWFPLSCIEKMYINKDEIKADIQYWILKQKGVCK